jgi:hypothetical protein
MEDTDGNIHVALVASKTRVAPIKRFSIPRLELCGAFLLTKLLIHVGNALQILIENVTTWMDSTIVINWPEALAGSRPMLVIGYHSSSVTLHPRVGTT